MSYLKDRRALEHAYWNMSQIIDKISLTAEERGLIIRQQEKIIEIADRLNELNKGK